MEDNPYAPTKGALNVGSLDGQEGAAFELASPWRRVANLLLDLACYFVLLMLIEIVNAILNFFSGIDIVGAVGPSVVLLILFAYYFLSEAFVGRTLGKLLTSTRVISESGGIAKPWQIFLRTLCRFVPFEAFSFLGQRGDGWHDKWSNTRVVIVQR